MLPKYHVWHGVPPPPGVSHRWHKILRESSISSIRLGEAEQIEENTFNQATMTQWNADVAVSMTEANYDSMRKYTFFSLSLFTTYCEKKELTGRRP